MRSMCGVSIGTKPKEANVLRNVSSIRSRGIIAAGGMSRSPLATRGSIIARSSCPSRIGCRSSPVRTPPLDADAPATVGPL